MRLKKWMLLLGYLYFVFAFVYLSYTSLANGNKIGYLWGICALAGIYQLIDFFIKKKSDHWNESYIVADRRIFQKITISLAISYVYIILFLLIGAIGLYQGSLAWHPLDYMFAAIISSLFVFMVSQIVQALLG